MLLLPPLSLYRYIPSLPEGARGRRDGGGREEKKDFLPAESSSSPSALFRCSLHGKRVFGMGGGSLDQAAAAAAAAALACVAVVNKSIFSAQSCAKAFQPNDGVRTRKRVFHSTMQKRGELPEQFIFKTHTLKTDTREFCARKRRDAGENMTDRSHPQ